jgi:toxin ParE1/3/4
MRIVDWSVRATEDFAAQLAYIAADNEFNAAQVRKRVTDAAQLLGHSPTGRMGRMDGTFEKFVSKTSLIIVYAFPDRERLTIVRVIHAARNFRRNSWPED